MCVRLIVALTVATMIHAASQVSSAGAAEPSRPKTTMQERPPAFTPREAEMMSRYGTVLRNLIITEVQRTPGISVIMLSLFSFGRMAIVNFAIDRKGKLLGISLTNDYNTIAVYDFATKIITRASANFPAPPAAVKAEIFRFNLALNFKGLTQPVARSGNPKS